MSDANELAGFAYGEHLEGVPQRSLGYRLLAPLESEAWRAEVELLARRLQAAPYSDHWPAADLFCSVLLADGRRLVALARYGLEDHTPSRRRGGLELVGVVGPARLEVPAALAVYRWLQARRAAADDLHSLGGRFRLDEVLRGAGAEVAPSDPVPVLPVRLWQDGAFLFAASSPSDPDHHLRLLEQGAGPGWQWLPLVGPDFPLATYTQRGPLIAWTAHLAGVALKLDPKPAESRPARQRSRAGLALGLSLGILFLGLLVADLWSTLRLHSRLTALENRPETSRPAEQATTEVSPSGARPEPAGTGRERFVEGLHDLLFDQGGRKEWEPRRAALLARYERLVRRHQELRVPEQDTAAKMTVAVVSVLAERRADRIEEQVRKALTDKGFSDRLIQAACEHVREQILKEIPDSP